MGLIRLDHPLVLTSAILSESAQSASARLDCDCACAAAPYEVGDAGLVLGPLRQWQRSQTVLNMPIDGEYVALFNPAGQGGVVAANRAAQVMLAGFAQPGSLADLPRPAVEAFIRHGLLQDASCPAPVAFQSGAVLSVWAHLTGLCNLRCTYCYIKKDNQTMSEPTGRAMLEAIFRSAQRHSYRAVKVKWAGGEPSLQSGLALRLHDHASRLAEENGIALEDVLLSNGVALSPDFIREMQARNMAVMISMDALGMLQDVQRPLAGGGGSSRLVERGIASLLEAGLTPHLSITISRASLPGLAGMVRYALERDLTFSLNFYRENGCTGRADMPGDTEMIAALHQAFAVIEEFLPPWNLLGTILDRGQLLGPRRRPCSVGQDYMVVDQQGRVAPCHMLMERTLGNVWENDPLELVRHAGDAYNPPVEEKAACRECHWQHWCSGGCALVAGADGRSPYCQVYQAIFPEAIRLEGLRLLKYARPQVM